MKLPEFLKPKPTSFDPSRRKIIKTSAQLAALTAVAISAPSLFESKRLELLEQIKSGLVENQIFYLDEPISLDVSDLVISRCEFHLRHAGPAFECGLADANILIHDCCIFTQAYPAHGNITRG